MQLFNFKLLQQDGLGWDISPTAVLAVQRTLKRGKISW
jgi:hypothetical protein